MIGHYSRHVGPRFGRGNWSGPRFFRGYRRPAFSYARPGSHRLSGRWQQPTAEQQALRSTAAEVARLFVIAARTAHGNAEQQGQLRAFLERSRKELSEFIYGSSQHPQQVELAQKNGLTKVGEYLLFDAFACSKATGRLYNNVECNRTGL